MAAYTGNPAKWGAVTFCSPWHYANARFCDNRSATAPTRTSSGPPDKGIEPLDFGPMSQFSASVVRSCYGEGPRKPLLLWILSARGSCLLRITADRGAIRGWLSRMFRPALNQGVRFQRTTLSCGVRKNSIRHEKIVKKNAITFENGNRAVVITASRDESGPFLNRLAWRKQQMVWKPPSWGLSDAVD